MMTNCFEFADRKYDHLTESRGNFVKSSVVTMEVLRENSDIILAMLEAFLYDPLLSWTVSRPGQYSELQTDGFRLMEVQHTHKEVSPYDVLFVRPS
jgi:phosphatidylinositol kinase/protein kinase (PI-3  family)